MNGSLFGRAAYASTVLLMLCGMTISPALAGATDAPAVVAQAATGTLAGTVTTAGGVALPDATITATGAASASATSDANGAFSIVVPPGLYKISVTHSGFSPASVSDVTVAPGITQPLSVSLSAIDLSSLRTIGSVTSGPRGSSINTSAANLNVLSAQQFANYPTSQINDVLQRIPDVVIQKLGSQQDQSIVVGGLQPYETQVLIDGHPIALGQYGVWFTQYFPSFLLGSVETQSGPGNTTPFANIAVGGTANLKTADFTTKTTVQATASYDSWQSQSSSLLLTGKTGNLSYVLGAGYAGTNDYFFKKSACDVYTPAPGPTFSGGVPGANQAGFSGIIAFCGNFGSAQIVKGTVYKLKYDFSPATSVEMGFLGSYGGYAPQDSAWGVSLGPTLIENCVPGTEFCNNPQYSNLVGKTINNAYFWYPGTRIFNNQQLFSGQLRTTFGDNTLLIRPYLGSIQPETYDGGGEKNYPAFFSPDATYPACPAIAPGAGPFDGPTFTCYAGPQTIAPGAQVPAVNGQSFPGANSFEYFNCPPGNITAFQQINSPTNTAVSVAGRQLCFQYPYSTFELDTLYGTTASFIHPMGEGFLDLTYDYHGQSTFAYANAPANVLVPPSATRFSTVSLTGDLRLIPKVSIPFGVYYTSWTANGQIIDDPVATDCPGSVAQCNLLRYESHIDPHVAFVWHPHSNDSMRAAYGTSTTYPFIGDLSGAPGFQPPASGFSDGLLTFKTPFLKPEHSIAYSLGADHRFANGSVVSLDLSDTIVHNVFQQIGSVDPFDPNLGNFQPLNISRVESKAAILKYTYAPRYGLGYNASMAADSSITTGVPASVMTQYPFTLPANNVQICGNGVFTPGTATCIPYLKGYGQVTYSGKNGTYVGLGMDFEGKNNSYYQPPFVMFDFSFRTPVMKYLEAALSVQNLFNQNSGSFLPAANLGVPVTSNFSTNGTTISQGSYPTYLIPAPTRTLRFELRAHVGRS